MKYKYKMLLLKDISGDHLCVGGSRVESFVSYAEGWSHFPCYMFRKFLLASVLGVGCAGLLSRGRALSWFRFPIGAYGP